LQDNIVSEGREESDSWDELPQVTMDRAQGLLRAIESLAARLELAENSLAEREAELASQVLVSHCGVQGRELSARIAEVLESSSKSIGAVAAAFYLLDEDTSQLKMRACFGLPKSRLFAAPRDLRSSLADLESLLGNAVLLNDLQAAQEWYSQNDSDRHSSSLSARQPCHMERYGFGAIGPELTNRMKSKLQT